MRVDSGSTAISGARGGTASHLVQGHEHQQERQVEQGGEEDPRAAGCEGGSACAAPQTQEERAEHQGAEEVDAAGQPDERRQQADREERQAAGHDLPLGAAAVGIDHRQHPDAGARVVVAVEPRDGERVRQLPEEQDPEEHPGPDAQLTARAATQPATGGRAPGTAPSTVQSGVTCLSGV